MKVSVLIGSRNRAQVLKRCLKSVLLQNYADFEVMILDDSDNPKEYEKIVESLDDPRIRILPSLTPLGVSGSRNELMKKANGEILFVIDDDAFFEDGNAFCMALEVFESHPNVGIIACRVENHGFSTKRYSVPFSRISLNRDPTLLGTNHYSSYFLGTAHAIRKQLIMDCGFYNSELFFGEEELDLSYRAIARGWKIYYQPEILVHHVPQSSVINGGGQANELYHHVKNRFYLAYRYLPGYYIPLYLGIWLFRYLLHAIRAKAISKYISGLAAGIRWLPRIHRDPLGSEALRYLRENFGRLWY
jgi:GT2 family glycosyltransferase